MPTVANDLVQFLMHLFGDREAVQEFLDNPEQALADHGLGNVCSADVDAAMPVVLDYAPITVNASSFERTYDTGSNGSWDSHGGYGTGYGSATYDAEDHAYAVQQLHHVVNHFSYTPGATIVDERATIAGQSAQQNVWAHGDVEQWFETDVAAPAGDPAAVAAGHAQTADIDPRLDPDDSFAEEPDHSGHALEAGLVPTAGDPYSDPSVHGSVAVDMHLDDPFQDTDASSLVGDNQLDFVEDNPGHPDPDLEAHHIIDVPVVDDSAGL
ncbi:IniB N-terminal domain-containing protein [Pseudarthrobacter sp. NPDC058196]|uniref:IniB N-terminal domain-containing protein n=1 Tax=Pseudarthrobacter sp. NPDC058196 TaxID=3346376 RepID=UPI0036D9A5F6